MATAFRHRALLRPVPTASPNLETAEPISTIAYLPESGYPQDTTTGSCTHQHIKRSGNRHGSYAACMQCGRKWKWNQGMNGWEHFVAASRSSRLPPPSSQTVLDSSWAAPTSTRPPLALTAPPASRATTSTAGSRSKAKPAAKVKTAAKPTTRPRPEHPDHWGLISLATNDIRMSREASEIPTDSENSVDYDWAYVEG